MAQEPTYSQIDAACKALYPNVLHPDQEDRKAMRLALIAAQGVDRNIYGDCHVGGSVGAVRFMTHTVGERTQIMAWEHSHTVVVSSLRKSVEDLKTRLNEANNQLGAARRWATDEAYMVRALVQMLGPKARKVWENWQSRGIVRQHTSWNPEFLAKATGEEVAQAHLDTFEAEKTAVPIDDIDAHIKALPQNRIDVV